MSHRIENFDIRRTILEFGRCFFSGSIAGGVLRNSQTLSFAINIRSALVTFALCANCGGHNVNGETNRVCTDCITNLNLTASKIESLLSSAARFSFALCDCAIYDSMIGIPKVGLAAANFIAQAMNSRAFLIIMSSTLEMISKRIQRHASEELGLTIEMRADGTKKHAKQESSSLEDHSFVLILIFVLFPSGRMAGHARRTKHRQSHIHLVFSPNSVSVGIGSC